MEVQLLSGQGLPQLRFHVAIQSVFKLHVLSIHIQSVVWLVKVPILLQDVFSRIYPSCLY